MGGRQRLFGFLTLVLLWTSAAAAQPARDVVVVGMEAEPPGLDPGQALGLHTLRVTYQIFETLVTTPDDSTDVVPGLAESWQTSPDGLAWTFKLRRGVRFHDGTPLDAQAVKFTFDRVIDPGQYRRAQRLIVEDAPWIFVDHEVQVVATRSAVKGFKLHPSGFDLRVEQMTRE